MPFAGLQRARRSGRGRPTAFLMTSVVKEVSARLVRRPRVVTCALWVERSERRM